MRRNERGQSLIEMTILVPLLLFMVIGVIDMGRAYNNFIIITNAAREGARFGSRFPHYNTGIKVAAITEASGSGVDLSMGDISIAGLYGAAGTPLRVTVIHDFPTILGQIIGLQNLELRSSTEMVIFGLN